MNRRAFAASCFAGIVAAAACRREPREPLVTYFNGDHGLTLRYPAGWKTEQAEQDGVWYRYFLPPPGSEKKPAVSVTLLAGPLGVPIEQYAQTYLAQNKLISSRDEVRQGAQGRSYVFTSPDGGMRYALFLVAEKDKVYGLYTQGDAAGIERHSRTLAQMQESLTLERLEQYPVVRDEAFAFSVRMPPSWKEARRFAGADTLLLQFTSPPFGADRGGQTVHASLTLTVELIAASAGLEGFYDATRQKLGEASQILTHESWGPNGYVDTMRIETPVAVTRVKRFYRAEGARGYSLTFETRDDVYYKVFRWYDLIASGFRSGAEVSR